MPANKSGGSAGYSGHSPAFSLRSQFQVCVVMYLSKRLGARHPENKAPKFTPLSIVVYATAAFLLLGSAPNAFAQGTGLFDGLFGSSSRAPARSSRNGYHYNSNSSGGQFWHDAWANAYSSRAEDIGRYRTLCVRTCDGYYFPISFSTTRSGLARDAKQCEARCGAPAKLFYHRNPGADVEHMVDLSGQPYSGMENAFRYRQEVVDSCRCTPQPWSEAAKQDYQHRAAVEKNPELAKIASSPIAPPESPAAPAAVAGWRSDAYEAPEQARNTRRRNRYRANDPALDGRWWAGSW